MTAAETSLCKAIKITEKFHLKNLRTKMRWCLVVELMFTKLFLAAAAAALNDTFQSFSSFGSGQEIVPRAVKSRWQITGVKIDNPRHGRLCVGFVTSRQRRFSF